MDRLPVLAHSTKTYSQTEFAVCVEDALVLIRGIQEAEELARVGRDRLDRLKDNNPGLGSVLGSVKKFAKDTGGRREVTKPAQDKVSNLVPIPPNATPEQVQEILDAADDGEKPTKKRKVVEEKK